MLHTRDLGAHLSLSGRGIGTTLTKRMVKATVVARRIRRLPTTYARKAMLVRTKVLTMGLYGIEATFCAEAAININGLRTAITDTIAPFTSLRSPALVFAACSFGEDVDPS